MSVHIHHLAEVLHPWSRPANGRILDLRGAGLRLTNMQFSVKGGEAEFRRLCAAYEEAWRQLSLQVDRWQSLCSDTFADRAILKQAEMAAWEAEARYREARNALAEYMLRDRLPQRREVSGRGTLVAERC